SEEHKVQEEDLAHHFFDDTADQDAAVNIEEKEASNVKKLLIPRGLSIPGPIQSQPQQQTQGTDTQGTETQGTVPKDKGKGILVEEPKKKKMTLQQIRALETTNDEEVARKIQAEWDAEEERKRFEELKKTKPKTTLKKPTSLAQERNQMMSFLKGLRPIQVMDSEEQLKAAEVLVSISRPRGLSIPGPIPGPIQTQPQQPTQGTDPKDKGKGILVEEPKKKKLTLQQIRALETTNDEEVARKIQAEWDAEEERKRFDELKKTKPKTTLRKPTSLAQERNQMMSFLKGQGYKNLQKLKYPQMKELYDKVQASIKDSFKDFIPMDSEKEREMLKEREAKRLLRKRKATISEEQPSKKPKLRTETIDELRNYLRVVDFEKNAQDRESLEGISMITELQVIDSPDGEYLIIHRGK
ncbi:hypothetical protein Tco_0164619, partial [Tanacetum coccineum]